MKENCTLTNLSLEVVVFTPILKRSMFPQHNSTGMAELKCYSTIGCIGNEQYVRKPENYCLFINFIFLQVLTNHAAFQCENVTALCEGISQNCGRLQHLDISMVHFFLLVILERWLTSGASVNQWTVWLIYWEWMPRKSPSKLWNFMWAKSPLDFFTFWKWHLGKCRSQSISCWRDALLVSAKHFPCWVWCGKIWMFGILSSLLTSTSSFL